MVYGRHQKSNSSRWIVVTMVLLMASVAIAITPLEQTSQPAVHEVTHPDFNLMPDYNLTGDQGLLLPYSIPGTDEQAGSEKTDQHW